MWGGGIMKYKNAQRFSRQDIQALKQARPLLEKKLEQATMQLSGDSFPAEYYDINLALVEQQIAQRRLEEIERILRTARI
jgi:hypothetical protein